MSIFYCKKCLNPSNHPLGIFFDKMGVCSGCLVHEEKYSINWKKKINDLRLIFDKTRNKNTYYDCIIPINGNGDDFYVVHFAKKILKIRPLLVSYNNHFNSKIGIRNTARLISKLDCDHLSMTLNPEIVKKITNVCFETINDIYWHVLAGNQAFPTQLAIKMKIPIILWGVNGWLDQVGKFSHHHNVQMTKRIWEEFSLRNLKIEKIIKKTNLNYKNFAPLIYPDLKEIYKNNLIGIYLGNYILWDAKKQTEEMIKLYEYETISQERTHNKYESIYCKINAGTHDLIKLLKHGYGKVTDHINRDIRFKRISRTEGMYIVKKYQKKMPDDLGFFLDWLKISKKLFFDTFVKYNFFKEKNNKLIFLKKDNIYNHLKSKTVDEINLIEKKLNYIQTSNLEKDLPNEKFIIFGRTYMDEKNFRAVE
jgi:N-acetyl sugar amidotransferase